MKRLDMFPKCADGEVFDAQKDFSMFLEEARRHASQGKAKQGAPSAKDAVGADEKRRKKSWKSSFFFWRKSEKKVKPENQILPPESTGIGSQFPKLSRRSATSGPIYGSGGRNGPTNQSGRRRPNSGPLSGMFTPSRRQEFEVPYMCLDQLDNNLTPTTTSRANMAFGPIYLVT